MLYLLYRIGRFLAVKLPIKACYKIAVISADIYYLFARDDRKNLRANLEIVLGTHDRKLIRAHIRRVFKNFAKYLADFFRFSILTKDYLLSHLTVEGKENLDKALAKGRGVILVTAHLGNWELGAAIITSFGYPFYAIALDHKDKRVNDFFLRQRAMVDVKIIPIGAQLKNCFRVLRENSLLAIVGDRDFSSYGLKVDFFGRPTILPKGPAFFSLKTGAAVIPTFPVREKGDTFRLIFDEPIISEGADTDEATVKNIMKKYTVVLERYIKSYPDQWYAFKKVWD